MKADQLLSPYKLSDLNLSNRMVMAPMTRSRAIDGNVPHPKAPLYYEQRATSGLIITEATQVSPQGVGYIRTPGIHSEAQIEGWKKVTEAVHHSGGKIFLQMWHVGRASHPDFHGGALPVAPSAISAGGESYTPTGPKKMVAPRALNIDEIPGIIETFHKGALNAKKAGFDGVEIHGANGYLLDQFTRDGANHRTDAYGGSIENRIRFPLEVANAVADAFGKDRVGYRISPNGNFNGMSDSNPIETFSALIRGLNHLDIAYLHVFDQIDSGGKSPNPNPVDFSSIPRKYFDKTVILNGSYDLAAGEKAIQENRADLIAYGVPFLANPDLVERFREGASLNTPDFKTFYAGEEKGWTDYPTLG